MILEAPSSGGGAHGVTRPTQGAQSFLFHKAQEVAGFCIAHGGKCFKDWPPKTVFAYVFYHLVDGGCFVLRANGGVAGVLFAWAVPEREVRDLAAAGQSPFVWKRSRNDSDAIFLAEVIGQRGKLGKLFKMSTAKWPNWQSKKILTFRDGKLTELPADVVKQFVYGLGGLADGSQAGGLSH